VEGSVKILDEKECWYGQPNDICDFFKKQAIMNKDNKCSYTPLKEPIPITEQEWPEGTLPLVHTRTMTYMHENFIRECLEGVLMQKTAFPVQVLIHDDASTDKTTEIVREYKLKHPKLIKTYYQKENTYSKSDKNEKHQLRKTFNSWRIGKYESICEGDDYWTDPLKLQKQVEFLEKNPAYVLSFHDCKIINEQGTFVKDSKLGSKRKRDYSKEDLVQGCLVPTLSVMFRAELLDKIAKPPSSVVNGDTFLFSNLGRYGKGHYHQDIQKAVYRLHSGGVWAQRSDFAKNTQLLVTYAELLKTHHPNYQTLLKQKLFRLLLKKITLLTNRKQKIKNYPLLLAKIPRDHRFWRNFLRVNYYVLFK
jgi:glycosyltransferase involved in cell wall biosynthesis